MATKPAGFRNIPPPPGSKAASPYQRFIPREELRGFASWQPEQLGDLPRTRGTGAGMEHDTPPPPPEPTAEDWRAQVHQARQAGYKEGYRDGLAALEGFKQSFAQQATAQIGELLQAFDQQLQGLDARIAQALADTAVALAAQVVRHELQTRPELVAQVAGEAVQAVMLSARHVTVQVHPLDLPLVAEGAEELLKARGARLQADGTLRRGDVCVDSDVGAVDARVATRWAQAVAALGSGRALDEADPGPGPSATAGDAAP